MFARVIALSLLVFGDGGEEELAGAESVWRDRSASGRCVCVPVRSAALFAMSGCGPGEVPRSVTTLCARVRTSPSVGGAEWDGGRGAESVNTEKEGVSSSRRAWARMPSSQLRRRRRTVSTGDSALVSYILPLHCAICQTGLDDSDLSIRQVLCETCQNNSDEKVEEAFGKEEHDQEKIRIMLHARSLFASTFPPCPTAPVVRAGKMQREQVRIQ